MSLDKKIFNNVLHTNFHLDIDVSDEDWYRKLEFFFSTKMWMLLWYIKVHIIDSEEKVARIIDVTTASWYNHLSKWLKEIYDNNWYDEGVFIKWKWSDFLSEVIKYINLNYPNRKVITVSCLEKNKPYLEPVIEKVKERVWEIIINVTWWWESSAFTIFLK